MALQTQCPHCDKIFSLKNSATLGKKLKCPKCAEPFVVKKYKAPEEEPADDYNFDYDEEDYEAPEETEPEEEEEAPRRKSSGGSRSKKKTSKKGGGGAKALVPILIGVAAVSVLGLVGWGGFVLISKLGGGNIVDMKYFPEETEMIFHLRPADIWNAPMLADVRNNSLVVKQLEEAKQGVDMQPTDMESITVGITNLSERKMFNRFTGAAMGPAMAAGQQQTFGVIRLKKDANPADLEKVPGVTKSTHAGQTLYSNNRSGKSVSTWLANPRLIAFGDDALVKAAIDRGSKEFRFKHLDFGKVRSSISMIAAPRGEAKPGTGGAPGSVDAVMNQHSKGIYLGIDISSEVTMESRVVCFSADGAKAVKGEFDKGIATAKQQIAQVPPFIANTVKPLIDVGTETLNSMKVTTSGSDVLVEGRITNKIVDAFKQMSNNPMFSGMMGEGMQPPPNMPIQPMPTSPGTMP